MREWIAPTRCAGCGAQHQGRLCRECVPRTLHQTPSPSPMIRGSWALSAYETPVGEALRKAKYGGDRQLTTILGDYLGDRLIPAILPGKFSAVVPAPSPWTRRLARGFSPASVVADRVGRCLGIPVVHALSLSPGVKQASLNRRDRLRGLSGRLRSTRRVSGCVLLVDDVVTTGSTAEASAVELLGDAATEVWLACLCQHR